MEDQRIFARINANFTARFIDPSNGREGRADTVDISANGVGIVTDDYLESMTPLELWLEIPDQHEPLYLRGEVVWSQPSRESSQRRVGVHLEDARLMSLARVLWFKKRAKETGG